MSDGWTIKPLAEVADLCLGKMLDKQKNRGEPQPYLRNANVRWFGFDLTDLKEMPFETDEHERYTARRGDVLICEGGYPGRAAVWDEDEPIYFQKALHRVRLREPERARWLVYYLWFMDAAGALQQHFNGSGIQHFTGESLARFPIPLPPLAEQRRIVELLDGALGALVTLNANTERTIANARELTSRYTTELLRKAGEHARHVPIGAVFKVQSGFAFPSADYTDGGHYLIRIGNVQDGVLHINGGRYVKLDKKTRHFELNEGDFLTSLTGNIGRVAQIESRHLPAALNQRVARLSIKDRDRLSHGFAAAFLMSSGFREALTDSGHGTAQQNVSPKLLAEVKMPLPDMAVQGILAAKVEEVAETCSRIVAFQDAKLTLLAELKQSLLSRAFAGELA